MATIKTALRLYDGVTAPLQSMHRAMNIVLNSFESMQRASGNSVDVSAIQDAREELARAGAAFDTIEDNIRQADHEQQRFNNDVRGGSSAANDLMGKIKGIVAALGAAQGLKKAVDLSDQVVSTKARLNVLVDDGGSLSELEGKIMASAQRSRSAYFSVADAVSKLGNNAGEAFGNNMDQIIAFSELVNKQFVLSGATAQEQAAAMLQLTQAMGSGVLRGDELNSIFEQAPGLIRNIADYMGVSVGEIRELASEGQITADIVKNAMFSAADEINAKFDQMPKTWGQIWTSMQNQALSAFEPVLVKINEIFNSAQFQQVADGIIAALTNIAMAASNVLDFMIMAASFIIDNWSWISPIFYGVAAALIAYKVASLAAAAAQAILNGVMFMSPMMQYALIIGGVVAAVMLLTEVFGSLGDAIMVVSAAVFVLNMALNANPIIAIASAILFVIGLFVKWAEAVGGFRIVWLIVVDAILTAWDNLKIGFWTGVFWVQNLLDDMSMSFAIAGANISGFIGDMKVNVLNILQAMVNGAIDLINAFINAVNCIPGVSIEPIAQVTFATTAAIENTLSKITSGAILAAKAGQIALNKGNRADTLADMRAQADADHASRQMNIKISQINGQIKNGMDALADNAKGALSQYTNMGGGMAGIGDVGAYSGGGSGIGNDVGGIAGDIAAMRDSLDIAEEDLQYLRDIAEREVINRFTTAEITVEQQNTNYIDQDTDLDGIMDAWAYDFGEKLEISEEGVHT